MLKRKKKRAKRQEAEVPLVQKIKITRQARLLERADKHRGSRKQKILMSIPGRQICWQIRGETWYRYMSTASDSVLRRLAASMLMASALEAIRPKRFSRQLKA